MPLRTNKVNPVLTSVGIVYSQAQRDFIAEQIFQRVDTKSKTFSVYKTDRQVAFGNNDWQWERSPGSGYKRGSWDLSSSSYIVKEWGRELPADRGEAKNWEEHFNLQRSNTRVLTQQYMVKREQECAAKVFATTAYTNSTTLSGTTQWSDYTNSDPQGNRLTAVEAVKKNTGRPPNTLVVGAEVHHKLMYATQIKNHFGINVSDAGLKIGGQLTALQIAAYFGVDRYLVGNAVYNAADEGQTMSGSYIWGKHALFAYINYEGNDPNYVAPMQFSRELSLGYTFEFTPRVIETYYEDQTDSDIVRIKHIFLDALTEELCGYMFINAVA